MPKMAILLPTDDLSKMDVYQRFLKVNKEALWRIGRKYSKEFFDQFDYPNNLYFFHKSIVRHRAKCINISASNDWPITHVPAEYRSKRAGYLTFILMGALTRVEDAHIKTFPKWDEPKTQFERGQEGILRVVDVIDGK